MKTKNRVLIGLISFIPLLVAETFILAFDYFEPENQKANINLCLIFGLVSLMIIVGKFCFDFIVTLIVNKSTKSSISAGKSVRILVSAMPLQWVTLILPIVLVVLGIDIAPLAISILITLSNIVYYAAVGVSFYRSTLKNAYIVTYLVMILITLISVFVKI
jgi:hypothetical protein